MAIDKPAINHSVSPGTPGSSGVKPLPVAAGIAILALNAAVLALGFFVHGGPTEWHTVWADRDFANALLPWQHIPNFGPALNTGGATPGPLYTYLLKLSLLAGQSLELQRWIAFAFVYTAVGGLGVVVWRVAGAWVAICLVTLAVFNSDISTITYYLYNPAHGFGLAAIGTAFLAWAVARRSTISFAAAALVFAIAAQAHLSYGAFLLALLATPIVARTRLSPLAIPLAALAIAAAYLPFVVRELLTGWPVVLRLTEELPFVQSVGWVPADQSYNALWIKPRTVRMLFDAGYLGSALHGGRSVGYLATAGIAVAVLAAAALDGWHRWRRGPGPGIFADGAARRVFWTMLVLQALFIAVMSLGDARAEGRHFAPVLLPAALAAALTFAAIVESAKRSSSAARFLTAGLALWVVGVLATNVIDYRRAATGYAADPVLHERQLAVSAALSALAERGAAVRGALVLDRDASGAFIAAPYTHVGSFYVRRDGLYEYESGDGACVAFVSSAAGAGALPDLAPIVGTVAEVRELQPAAGQRILQYRSNGGQCLDNVQNPWQYTAADDAVLAHRSRMDGADALLIRDGDGDSAHIVRLLPGTPVFALVTINQRDGQIHAELHSRLLRTFLSLYPREVLIAGARIELNYADGTSQTLPLLQAPANKQRMQLLPKLVSGAAAASGAAISAATVAIDEVRIEAQSPRNDRRWTAIRIQLAAAPN